MTQDAPVELATPGAERKHVDVSEVFLSFQGEGPSCGERALFLRVAGCNLACKWCDTRYAWDWRAYEKEHHSRRASVSSLVEEICRQADDALRLLVVTGGEPLLQQEALSELLTGVRLRRPELRCEVETNGTVPPTTPLASLVCRFVVSPKLGHAGGTDRRRLHPKVLRGFAELPASVFKFVAVDEQDIASIESLCMGLGIAPARVWLMPVSHSASEMAVALPRLAPAALGHKFNLSGRSQLFWDSARDW